jgi:hypothetical protein
MKDTVKNVFNSVFSFGGFMVVVCSAVFYVALLSVDKSQAETKACFLAGMVKVRTDAGSFCTAPSNLVEIK